MGDVEFGVVDGPEYWVKFEYNSIVYMGKQEIYVKTGRVCIRALAEARLSFPARKSYILPAREAREALGTALSYAVKELVERVRRLNALVEEYISEGFKISGINDSSTYIPFYFLAEGEASTASVLKALRRAGLKADKIVKIEIKRVEVCR